MKFPTLLLAIIMVLITACSPGGKINGNSTKTAFRSVKMLKRRLPESQRIAFEMSFWSIRETSKDTKEFLNRVHGQTPQQIIEVGKEIFAERKANGVETIAKFSTFDEMIEHYIKERRDQSLPKQKYDPKEDHSVLYKLRSF